MPAALLAAALAALLSAAPLSARPAPPAPSPSPSTQPLLLVARAACLVADPAAFSQARLERYASATVRFSGLRDAYRLLGFEETCGTQWEATTTRFALAALSAGGGVVSSGRLGGGVCDALAAASVALRRPAPAACAERAARGAAVAWLARRLRWRRALAAPGEGRECAAALSAVERALSAAGVLVRRARRDLDDALRPHVVILCESSIDSAILPETLNRTELLLLRVAGPTTSQRMHKIDPIKDNFILTPKSVSHTYKPNSFKAFWDTFSASYRISDISTEHSLVFNNATESIAPKNLMRLSNVQSINEDKPRTSIGEQLETEKFYRGRRRTPSTADHNKTLSDRLLILSDEVSEADPTVQSLYDEILDAALLYIEASRSGVEYFRNNFVLYKSTFVDGTATWTHMASMSVVSQQSVGRPDTVMTTIAIDLPGELELQRWSVIRPVDETPEWQPGDPPILAHVTVVVLGVACAVCGIAAITAACARRVATRRVPRRPRAVPVLASTDFQFPADERRRVGEGMETMLSWLQQLHEFGGPEPERPDLLKRPEPLGQSAPSSTCSVTRLTLDNRTRYKGDPVHMKYLPAASLELRRKTIDILLVMQSLRHENLNPFIGCLSAVRPALVFEACGRGSLEDVLMADDIALDWTFRLSLLTDCVRGMRYLHASPVRVHARLSSRNCVVDSRWVLRITDYGLPALATAQALPYPPRTARELLWTAPELLRGRSAATVPGGTQMGDVYSFAIIMQEVIVRGEPYCMLPLTPEELVQKLQHPPPLVRPSVSLGAAPPDAVGVMRQCWSEQPELRPDFARLYELFRHMHRGRKTNIVDSMFEMLEKYSNNLEELIKDRTEQLDMEKKKTEQLLNRMLPRSVAERLMLGLRVEPEEFEEVSIYFSDIVGFTAIAARSSPVQVVDLLNDLYTTFDAAIEQYRVYKVETIGDAYMVVGGLPIRCADHAESVATMALHLLHLAGRFRIRHLPGAPLHLRIGLHTGACCAGVVGLTMPRYCLFGDTVNTASRMESTGAAWRVQVSGATAERLAAAGGFRLRSRGLTQVKGKGAMHTYWLLGKDGFDKPLPSPPPLESEEVLFEAEGDEEECETSAPRLRSEASPAADRLAWQRSGAVSAESSPPALPLPRCRYLRSSVSTVAGLLDTPRLSDRWGAQGPRVLRRQWSLERGDALAAAAAGVGGADVAVPLPLEPLALRAGPARAPPPRYRTRRDASMLDVSDR